MLAKAAQVNRRHKTFMLRTVLDHCLERTLCTTIRHLAAPCSPTRDLC